MQKNPHLHAGLPTVQLYRPCMEMQPGNKLEYVTVEGCLNKPYQSNFMLLGLDDFSKRVGKFIIATF